MDAATRPYIATLCWPADAAEMLDGLRAAYFPPERNVVPAHLTLFHALPAVHLAYVEQALLSEARSMAPFRLQFVGPITLGRGVALRVRSAALEALRRRLAQQFWSWLTPQDRQGFRGHVTVQNKVHPCEAQRTLAALSMAWNPSYETWATGIRLWRYLSGPWQQHADFPFATES